MTKTFGLQLFQEILWVCLTVMVAMLSLWSVYGVIWERHLWVLFIMALLFFTVFRFLVFFNGTLYMQFALIRAVLFFLNIMVFFVLYDKMERQLFLMDNYDFSEFVIISNVSSGNDIKDISTLYKKEFIFFSVSALILQVILGFRLLVSFFALIRKMR